MLGRVGIVARLGRPMTKLGSQASSGRCGATSAFHTSRPSYQIAVGDRIPSVSLAEDAPGKSVDVAAELKNGGVLIGVPGAFTPVCSSTHLPDFIKSDKTREFIKSGGGKNVFVITVNDAFVTKAWADVLDPGRKSGIRFLADPKLELTKALQLEFNDLEAVFGGPRSSRYALLVGKDAVVEKTHIEPDKTSLNVSAVDKVLA